MCLDLDFNDHPLATQSIGSNAHPRWPMIGPLLSPNLHHQWFEGHVSQIRVNLVGLEQSLLHSGGLQCVVTVDECGLDLFGRRRGHLACLGEPRLSGRDDQLSIGW